MAVKNLSVYPDEFRYSWKNNQILMKKFWVILTGKIFIAHTHLFTAFWRSSGFMETPFLGVYFEDQVRSGFLSTTICFSGIYFYINFTPKIKYRVLFLVKPIDKKNFR